MNMLMNMLLLLIGLIGYAFGFDGYTNQSFLFISGIPQSGTSLLNNLVGAAPALGTMEKKCEELHGKSCVNWNHEGQWMLPRNPLISDHFKPGKMCSISPDTAALDKLSGEVMTTWMKYWDMSASILVEKSPQSMLKITLYRDILRKQIPGAKMKALVVLKHPITLNSAIKGEGRDPNWATHVKSGTISRLSSREKKREPHSDQALLSNIWQFIHFMRGDVDIVNSTSTSCTKSGLNPGWLQSISSLVGQLKDMSANADNDGVEVGVLRYENLLQPALACQAIFRFIIFDSPDEYKRAMADSEVNKGALSRKIKMYNNAIKRACGTMVTAKPSVVDKSPFEWGKIEHRQGRRKLRLRDNGSGRVVEGHTRLENVIRGVKDRASPLSGETPVSAETPPASGGAGPPFSIKLAHRSIYSRTREFSALFRPAYYSKLVQKVHTNGPSGTGSGKIEGRPAAFATAAEEIEAIASALEDIQARLSPLGYSLNSPYFSRASILTQVPSRPHIVTSEDHLMPWDLVKNYGRL